MKSEKEIKERIEDLVYEQKVDNDDHGDKFKEWYKGALSQLRWVVKGRKKVKLQEAKKR